MNNMLTGIKLNALAVATFVFLGASCVDSKQGVDMQANRLPTQVNKSEDTQPSVKSDFEGIDWAASLEKESKAFDLKNLKDKMVKRGDLEIRLWKGFGLFYPACFRFSNNGTMISAEYLKYSGRDAKIRVSRQKVDLSFEQRERLLKLLSTENGIIVPLNLAKIGESSGATDQDFVVIEIRTVDGYDFRAYEVGSAHPEARKVEDLYKTIYTELRLSTDD